MHWLWWIGSVWAVEPMLVIEVELGPVDRAWMLEMRTGESSVQVPCSDDGTAPDRLKNDDRATCSGTAPGHDLKLLLRDGENEHVAQVSWPEDMELLQARWGPDGVVVDSWSLEPDAGDAEPREAMPSAEAQNAVGDMLEATASQRAPVEAPAQKGADDFWWAALALVLLGAVAWWIAGVGEVPHVERVAPSGPRLRRVPGSELAPIIRDAAQKGTVLVALPDGRDVPGAEGPGPVLRATSLDVMDLLDALAALARRDPLATVSLVADGSALTHVDGLGVPALEALERSAHPSVQVVVLEG